MSRLISCFPWNRPARCGKYHKRCSRVANLLRICDHADVRPFMTLSKALLAMIAIAGHCGACTVFYPHVQVGPNFRVRVEDQGRPVKGLRVEISRDRFTANRVVTDRNGFALFRNVRSGLYHLSVDHDAGVPAGANVEVRLDGPTESTVPLTWPSSAPVLVRSLKGTIHAPEYLPGQFQPRLSLALLEGVSGRRLKGEESTDKGEFNFGDAAPGLYFLYLKPSGLSGWSGEQITGLIAVAVD